MLFMWLLVLFSSLLNLFIVQDEDEFPELNSDNGSSKSSNIQQKISPKVVSNYFVLQSIFKLFWDYLIV